MLRPFGTTLGHSLEWSRLLLQLWELGDRKLNWLPLELTRFDGHP